MSGLALGVPQDGAAECSCFKDIELLEQSETVQDILPISFRLRLCPAGVRSRFDGMCLLREKEIDHAGFLVSEGPSFALIAFPARKYCEISGKALTFCAKYRKYHLHWHF